MCKGCLTGNCLTVALAFTSGLVEAATSIEPFVQYSIRDAFPEDGIADYLIPSIDSSWIGQVTGPGSADFEEQTFLEYDLRSLAVQGRATFQLTLFHGGSDKLVSLSIYIGDGAASLADWDAGDLLTTVFLPFESINGSQHMFSIDVTNELNEFIQSGHGFLGLRLHDAIYVLGSDGDQAQVALGNGFTVPPQPIDLEPIPEPSTCALGLFALLYLGLLTQAGRLFPATHCCANGWQRDCSLPAWQCSRYFQ
jgi:hypothetical protein